MRKILLTLVVSTLIITGCNLKVNLNTNGSSIKVEPSNSNQNQNLNQPEANANVNQAISAEPIDFKVEQTGEGMLTKILDKKTGETIIAEPKVLCSVDTMVYAQPANSSVLILTQFNPGSDKPISSLYVLNLKDKSCTKLAVSKELSDFGARVLSPDQTKLAVALETNEAKDLKVLDLIANTAKPVVTLGDGETLNGGYGALSDKFQIKWLDDSRIQYTVYEDTVKDYAANSPVKPEKVKAVRIVDISK